MKNKLFKIKQEIGKLSKNATNPFFKSKYLDLNDLLTAVEEVLKNNNVLLLQPIDNDKVITQLIDIDSDEIITSSCLIPQTNDPQKLGSTITYLRRYTLVSLLGLQAVDDDANLASDKVTTSDKKEAPQPTKWLNDAEFELIKKRIESGKIPTLEVILENFKISKVMKAKLESIGVK